MTGNRIEWLSWASSTAPQISFLSEMRDKGLSFETDVGPSTAQALGYAEADPSFDIEGC